MVAPALEKYERDRTTRRCLEAAGALCPRDRGLVTLAALIARNQANELPFYLGLALDNGVRPAENLRRPSLHSPFYAGWGERNPRGPWRQPKACFGRAQDRTRSAARRLTHASCR